MKATRPGKTARRPRISKTVAPLDIADAFNPDRDHELDDQLRAYADQYITARPAAGEGGADRLLIRGSAWSMTSHS